MTNKLITAGITVAGVAFVLGGIVLETIYERGRLACGAGFLGAFLILLGVVMNAASVRRNVKRTNR
jgi:hypothetical protein